MNKAENFGISMSLTLEQRISNRKIITSEKVIGLSQASPQHRAKHLIHVVAQTEEVWTRWDNENLEVGYGDDKWAVEIWPYKECVKFSYQESKNGVKVTPIPMVDFINEILFVDSEERYLFVFPANPYEKTQIFSAVEFCKALAEAIAEFNPPELLL